MQPLVFPIAAALQSVVGVSAFTPSSLFQALPRVILWRRESGHAASLCTAFPGFPISLWVKVGVLTVACVLGVIATPCPLPSLTSASALSWLILLQLCPHCLEHKPDALLPYGLCTCSPLSAGCASSRGLHGQLCSLCGGFSSLPGESVECYNKASHVSILVF